MATSESARVRRRAGSAARHAVLLAFSALALFPIYFMVVNSLKTSAEYAGNAIGLPHHLVVSTLHAALAGGDLYRWLLNSLLITAASVLKIGRASCRERV